MNNRKKLLKILLPICAAVVVIVGAVLLLGNQSATAGKVVGGGSVRTVAYDNPMDPAPGSQVFDMLLRNEKLASGPKEIHSIVGSAFKINVTAYTSAPELEFYVESYTDNAEIDSPSDDQEGVLMGQVYIHTDHRGKFQYGVENETNHKKSPLGTLYVE